MNKHWTSLMAFMMVLLFAAMADGLMDVLGPLGFMAVGFTVLGIAWKLTIKPGQAADAGPRKAAVQG